MVDLNKAKAKNALLYKIVMVDLNKIIYNTNVPTFYDRFSVHAYFKLL